MGLSCLSQSQLFSFDVVQKPPGRLDGSLFSVLHKDLGFFGARRLHLGTSSLPCRPTRTTPHESVGRPATGPRGGQNCPGPRSNG